MSNLRNILKNKNSDYLDLFKANIVKVKPILEKCTPIDFTFHGLNHCITLERYTEELIPENIKNKLNAEEIFILLNSIYYHDIGMINYDKIEHTMFDSEGKLKMITELVSNRNEHNVISKKMIYYEEDNDFNKELISLPNNDASFANSISMLCEGHRDYKTKENEFINTLEKIPLTESYHGVVIHTRTLACILRIADELDITNERAPSDVLIHLKSFISPKSVEEWMKHELFGRVEIDSKRYQITLHPHIINIKSRDKELKDRTKTRNLLFSKLSKIDNELENIEEVIDKDELENIFKLNYKKAKIKFDESTVKKEDKAQYLKDVGKAFENETGSLETEKLSQVDMPVTKEERKKIIDFKTHFLKGIEELDNHKKLVSVGFFELPSNLYSKYYLNTNKIISKNNLLNSLTNYYKNELENLEYDFILGIDKTGIIIGSNLSIKTRTDFTYAMFSKNENHYSIEFEKFVSNKIKGKKIVIVTDVIASGSTLRITKEECEKKYQISISAICSIFSVNADSLELLKSDFNVPFLNVSNEYSFETFTIEQIEKDNKLKCEFELLKKTH
jgi:orotate phosphoribosyltransferase